MALKVSTGLRNAMLVTGSFKNQMDLCSLKIYAGTVPASADAALGSATLLCTVTNDATATGLTFEASATDGILSKTVSEIWRGVNSAGGVATFYRLETSSDDGSLSTTLQRIQGSVAVSGADLNLSNTTLVNAASQTIDHYTIAIPTA